MVRAAAPMTGSAAGVARFGAAPRMSPRRMFGRGLIAALAVAIGLGAAPAMALEPLAQEQYINDRLIAARIADRIRRECPRYGARIIYAFNEARALKRYAQNKGYSNAQIDAFLDSKEDKRRIYATAEDYLTRKGAREGDPESFCAVGQQEFAANSYIATFLVAR